MLAIAALSFACQGGGLSETGQLDALPDWLTVAETHGVGRPAVWGVEKAGYLRLAETSNTGQTYNLLFVEQDWKEVELKVRLRADSGEEDQGGGLFWRALGPDDYYVARWNPLEHNLRLYHVVGGKRTQLASTEIRTDPRAWHLLEVSMQGQRIRVRFDDADALLHEDDLLDQGGGFGMWTKADAATSFDEFMASGF